MKLTKKQADELRTLAEGIDREDHPGLTDALYDLGEEGECEDREEATDEVASWLRDLRAHVDELLRLARKFKLDV
jgi:hypothetical protein